MSISYYAVELCRYSVEELIKNENTETVYAHVWKSLTREKILHQTTLGLDYLHRLQDGFIHGNIHGRNVLVAEIARGNNTHYVIKLSDFYFYKSVQRDALTKWSSSWIAPEMNDPESELGPCTNVFILGWFFHYVLSGGHHPYGRKTDRIININNPKYEPKELETSYLSLIKCMCSFKPTERPSTGQILCYLGNVKPTFFPLYLEKSTLTTADGDNIRPGLCVVFHQGRFNPVRI